MGRLIDEDDVMEMLTNVELSCTVIPITEAKLRLRDIPTAYEPEKVVAEIRSSSGNGYRDVDGDWVPPMIETKDAIEIVRRGGVE